MVDEIEYPKWNEDQTQTFFDIWISLAIGVKPLDLLHEIYPFHRFN